jgi:membrane-bound metal-dependent hydrolase YbcI (DUF457 family)
VPRRATHQAVGALACGVFAYVVAKRAGSKDPFSEGLGGAAAGWLVSTLPDVFEPARSPSHRASAHSIAAGALVSSFIPNCLTFAQGCRDATSHECNEVSPTTSRSAEPTLSQFLTHITAGFALGLCVAYLSHLALDGCTPRGLPLA